MNGENRKVSRRSFAKTAATGIVGLAVGAGIGYAASSMMAPKAAPGVTRTVTTTATTTVTGTPAPKIDEIKIGCIEPLTGTGGSSGQEIQRVYELFIEDYNAKGGVKEGPFKGAKIKLVWGDAQSQPETGRAEAERILTQENVHLILGSMWSSITATMKTETEKRGFPHLNCAAAAITLTKNADSKWFWRTGPHDENWTQFIAAFLKDLTAKYGVELKKVGISYTNDNVGNAWRDYFRVFNQNPDLGGYEIAYDIPLIAGTPSIDSELLTIKKANPDVVIQNNHIAEGILIQKGLRQYDINPKIIISNSTELADKRFAEAVGDLADSLVMRSVWNYDVVDPISKEFDDLFMNKYGYHVPDGRYVVGIMTATKAFERVRTASLEPEVLQQTFNEMYLPPKDIFGPAGVKFNPPGHVDAGQNMLAAGVMLQYFGQTDLYTVYPFDLASKEIVFPLKTWEERGL